MRSGRGFALAGFLAGCASPPADPPKPPATDAPRYDEIWAIATHNSYWVDRGVPNDAFASGVGERMVDQLLGDGARSLEIDIHRDRDNPGKFLVYHTEPGNSQCASLADCLAMLRTYHEALPDHEPTLVVLELKEVAEANFDASHSFADLDRELREGLGDALYEPSDYLGHCAELGEIDVHLATCAEHVRWPEARALRGKFIVGVLGNWDVVASATADWAAYASSGVVERAAFPMASSWKLDYPSLSSLVQEKISAADFEKAKKEIALVQVEDTTDPLLAPFLSKGAIVRIDNAFSTDDQAARVALGAQLLQTDTPWVAYGDAGITQPFRSYRAGVDPGLLAEPGDRIGLLGVDDSHVVFAYRTRPAASSTHWETTAASGHDATRAGCLRAESDAVPRSVVSLCRKRLDDPGMPDNQMLVYELAVCDAAKGMCTTEDVQPIDQAFAERFGLEVTSAASGMSCVDVLSGAGLDAGGHVTLASAGANVCVGAPLVRQGIGRNVGAGGPALFYLTLESADGAEPSAVSAADFDAVISESANVSMPDDTPRPDLIENLRVLAQ